ncbi:hypothetical protein T4D_118 [Trichinella pseudospiralis]|uniref:Uncharacterized protein n=1 Tax=Trichinella pseudospiralis TaxID=6337 RepID=A0A0V1DP40_TRIPS|nr:hypothetical protein T4D_118 [Trichinella pseudospiralis]
MVLYELLEIVFAYKYIRISGEQPPIMNNHLTTAPTIGSMECSIQ